MDNQYDEIIAVGPPMMKLVAQLTKKYGEKTVVSMNPIMIDGTGMGGGHSLTVGGETRFARVDGPDFDGHLVDFDEAITRGRMYSDFEAHPRGTACNPVKAYQANSATPIKKSHKVAVVGGGNVTMAVARYAKRLDTEEIRSFIAATCRNCLPGRRKRSTRGSKASSSKPCVTSWRCWVMITATCVAFASWK